MEFVAKFIKIDWIDYNKNRPINECIYSINDNVFPINTEISEDGNVDYELFINTYHHANFAICFNVELDEPPYIQPSLNSTSKLPMLEVFCAESHHYWIQKKDKLKKSNQHPSYMESDFNNHISTTHIIYKTKGEQKIIRITIEEPILDSTGKELILREFKNEFYKLIFKNNSLSSDFLENIPNSSSTFNIPNFKMIDEIIETLFKIKQKPYLELGAKEELSSIRKIRTTTKTIIEYGQNPNRKFYTSKTHQERIDNTVNGFVLFLAKNIIIYLEEFIKNLEFESLSQNTNITLMQKTMQEIEQEIINQNSLNQEWLDSIIKNQKPTNKEKLQQHNINGLLIKGNVFYFFNGKMIKFKKDIEQKLKTGNYSISGYGCYKTTQTKNNYFNFEYIDNIQILSEEDHNIVAEKSFNAHQSSLEIEKNNQENRNKENQRLIHKTINKLKTKKSLLREFCCQFEKMGVKIFTNKPSSKVFEYEIRYSRLIKLYNSLKIKKNLDTLKLRRVFHSEILLSNIPKIYERWVLLKIIFILIEKYKFQPINDDWNIILANQLCDKNKNYANTVIRMNNILTSDNLNLYYEKVLENGKNPDYMIEYKSKNLIMDAKFQILDLLKMITYLKDKKDYKEGEKNNWVYVIAPMENLVKNPVSGMVWSKNAYYGESLLLEQTENYPLELPNHSYGGIFVHPDTIKYNLNNLDNLQRLIGMFLQINGYEDCIVCGHKCQTLEGKEDTKSTKKECLNPMCKHRFWINYCKDCYKPIYKNGGYWTYHQLSLSDHSLSNVVCPTCGSYFRSTK